MPKAEVDVDAINLNFQIQNFPDLLSQCHFIIIAESAVSVQFEDLSTFHAFVVLRVGCHISTMLEAIRQYVVPNCDDSFE